jgi:hypothetical protein
MGQYGYSPNGSSSEHAACTDVKLLRFEIIEDDKSRSFFFAIDLGLMQIPCDFLFAKNSTKTPKNG